METKVTPGPWQKHEVGESITKLAVTDSDGMSVLTVVEEDGMTFGAVFNEADASLIAAAPDLLAVLERLVDCGGIGPEEMLNDAIEAIAKATGSNP